jgi:hypothetical protein
MTITTAETGHAAWFRDVRRILEVTEVTPGLPLPRIGGTRASFHFTAITHAAEAAEAVALAETILGYVLHVAFKVRQVPAGDDTLRYILEGYMPDSGLMVAIVAKAEHMQAPRPPVARESASELAELAA